VAIRPPKHHSEGFTLIEMIVILMIVGIISGFALPSLLSLNKPLRDGVSQFKSQLNLIRAKAIASNKAYRIKPLYPTRAEYYNAKTNPDSIPRNFTVEYAANCSIPLTTRGGTNGWNSATQFDLDLPKDVGITDNADASTTPPTIPAYPSNVSLLIPPSTTPVTVSNNLANWGICFDNRGLVSQPLNFVIKDFQGNHRAKIALFNVLPIGGSSVFTYDKLNNRIPDDSF
jgi:prepilin-type N-terminal cleavage/methylation domain-containing protein